MISVVIRILALCLVSTLAFAHGEDKPGPHGGVVQMPGAFHTELVKLNKNSIKVFLLDVQWQRPVTENSKVEMQLKDEKVQCKAVRDHFLCQFSAKTDLDKKGDLKVDSQRLGVSGATISYDLPLKLAY